MESLEIKLDNWKLPCISRFRHTITVLCVNGKEYVKSYKNVEEAKENMNLCAIVPEWGWKEIK